MPNVQQFTFKKSERLSGKIEIDRLFGGGSKSMSAFPLKVVYRLDEADETNVAVLISVSKKRFRRAVKRNRVKRQIREAFRKNKFMLWKALEGSSKVLSMAFLWLDDQLYDSTVVEKKVINLIQRISEKVPDWCIEKAEYEKPD